MPISDRGGAADNLSSDIIRLAGGLPASARQPVLSMLRQWQEARTQAGSMQRELDEVSAMAQAQLEQLQVGTGWSGVKSVQHEDIDCWLNMMCTRGAFLQFKLPSHWSSL